MNKSPIFGNRKEDDPAALAKALQEGVAKVADAIKSAVHAVQANDPKAIHTGSPASAADSTSEKLGKK